MIQLPNKHRHTQFFIVIVIAIVIVIVIALFFITHQQIAVLNLKACVGH